MRIDNFSYPLNRQRVDLKFSMSIGAIAGKNEQKSEKLTFCVYSLGKVSLLLPVASQSVPSMTCPAWYVVVSLYEPPWLCLTVYLSGSLCYC